MICKAVVSEKGNNIHFESATIPGTTIPEIIEGDKKYGKMVPYNGKYFTYKAVDWNGKWINYPQIQKALTLVWNKAEKVIQIEAREAKTDEFVDFKVYFRKTSDDPNLTTNTLMYHYYPINDFNSQFRGVCVVNTDFAWTSDGKGIPLHIYDPEHYPEPTKAEAMTFDFDAVYEHEGIGHGLGLPHSPNQFKKMSSNYSIMAESIFEETDDETILRLQAKYPKRNIVISTLKRWIRWFKVRQDNY